MTHEIKIEPIFNQTSGTRILVDGNEVHNVTSFYLSQDAGETPTLSLRIKPHIVNFEQNCNLKIYNKDDIAKLMDKSEFMDFCDIWKRYHRE